MTGDSYIADRHLRRLSDGSYVETVGHSVLRFGDADEAMAYHATAVRRIAAIERAHHEAAREKAAKNGATT